MKQNKGKIPDHQTDELVMVLVANMPKITLKRIGGNGINNVCKT
jgi:hypothetical protein